MFPLWGNGSGSYLRELSAELIKRGHTVGIVAPDKRQLADIKLYSVNAPQAVFVGHPEMPKAKPLGEMKGKELGDLYATYLHTSLAAVEDFKPDVVHVFHTAFLPEIGRTIKAMFGIRYIMTTHGSDLAYLVKDRRFIPLISDANRGAKYITAVSDFTKKWYFQIFGYAIKRKTLVIPGGVNLAPFKRDLKVMGEIDKKYKVAGQKIVLFTGRLTKNKGVVYLVRAAEKIKGTIMIVGDGPERPVLEAEIKKRNLKNVILVGYMQTSNPMYHAFYERANLYVSPSVWDEPLGLTILEAMAAQTAVVATRKGGVLSIIADGVNGTLIKARNSKELGTVVNALLLDDERRIKLRDNGYKTVIEKFAWPKIAQRFEKLYEETRVKEKIVDAGPLDRLVKKIMPIKTFLF
ncbi:MAG: glycosyltransferase family 4 protein [Candidatus Levybacteria bacterium]|nr:glycosyltransferase family 4 protein [Candidatus Levybacteria bacterium]